MTTLSFDIRRFF